MKDKAKSKFVIKFILCVIWAIPWVALGGLCCATGFLILPGIGLITIGIAPLAKTHRNRIKQLVPDPVMEDMPVIEHEEPEVPWKL